MAMILRKLCYKYKTTSSAAMPCLQLDRKREGGRLLSEGLAREAERLRKCFYAIKTNECELCFGNSLT